MSLTDFQTSRATSMTSFQSQYDALKTRYRADLDNAVKEADRPKQCGHIKDALDTNKKMTELVQGFLAVSDPENCKLSQGQLRDLHADMKTYKDQFAEIQQGADKQRSLENAYASVQDQINVTKGASFWYLVLLIALTVVAVSAMVSSSIRSALNAQAVAPVFPGRFA